MLRDRAKRGQKTLGVTRRFEPLHAPLTLTRWPMRVLTTVVEIATLAMLDTRQNLTFGRAIAP